MLVPVFQAVRFPTTRNQAPCWLHTHDMALGKGMVTGYCSFSENIEKGVGLPKNWDLSFMADSPLLPAPNMFGGLACVSQ